MISTGARHGMAYVKESAYGQTPSTPAFKKIRHTSTTLALSKETIQSEELRADRQLAGFKHGNKQVGGDIGFEFSYDSFDDFLEAALGGTWANDVLKVGVNRRSFTVEREFSDIRQFHRFTGVELNGFSLSVAPNAMITGSFTTIGQGMSTAAAIVTGATYAEPNTNTPFDSFTGGMSVNGKPSNVVTSIELTLENGLEALFVVGSNETLQPSIGRSNVTGSMSVYFEDSSMIDRFINEEDTALEFTLAGDGGAYTFKLPRIKFGSGAPEVSGTGPIILNMEFQALFDETAATNMMITRAPTKTAKK